MSNIFNRERLERVNRQKWEAELNKKVTANSDWTKIIREYYMVDNISYEKCTENLKANAIITEFSSFETWKKIRKLSIYESSAEEPNCTPTFRKYYCQDKFLSRNIQLPDWWYIGYPDVAHWVEVNADSFEIDIERKLEEYDSGNGLDIRAYRLLIDLYKRKEGQLECSI